MGTTSSQHKKPLPTPRPRPVVEPAIQKQGQKEKEKVTVYAPAMVQKWWEEIAHLAWKQ